MVGIYMNEFTGVRNSDKVFNKNLLLKLAAEYKIQPKKAANTKYMIFKFI